MSDDDLGSSGFGTGKLTFYLHQNAADFVEVRAPDGSEVYPGYGDDSEAMCRALRAWWATASTSLQADLTRVTGERDEARTTVDRLRAECNQLNVECNQLSTDHVAARAEVTRLRARLTAEEQATADAVRLLTFWQAREAAATQRAERLPVVEADRERIRQERERNRVRAEQLEGAIRAAHERVVKAALSENDYKRRVQWQSVEQGLYTALSPAPTAEVAAPRCHPECQPKGAIVGPCDSCKRGAVVADGDGTFTCRGCGLDIHGPWAPNQCEATDMGLRCIWAARHRSGHFFDHPGRFEFLSAAPTPEVATPGETCNRAWFDPNTGGGYCGHPLPCPEHTPATPAAPPVEAPLKTCTNCGEKSEANDRWCIPCGRDFPAPAAPAGEVKP